MLQIRNGIDLIRVERIRGLIDRQGVDALERIWTPEECQACGVEVDVAPHAWAKGTWESLAARFAAKEAAVKALGTGVRQGIGLVDVSIFRDRLGAPHLRFTGEAQRRVEARGVISSSVSLSHEGGLAMAQVVLLCEEESEK